jgi:hypothetical protein
MKKLLIVGLLVLSATAFSKEIKFKCVSVDYPGVHKFDGSGIVTVDDNNKVEGVVAISTQKAQSTQSIQTFDEVRVEGLIRHYEAGEFAKNSFDHLTLTSNEPYIKNLNLLLNFETKISSRVLSIDNFSYRADCKIVD